MPSTTMPAAVATHADAARVRPRVLTPATPLFAIVAVCAITTLQAPIASRDSQIAGFIVVMIVLVLLALRMGQLRVDNAHLWALFTAILVGTLPRLAAITAARESPSAMARDYSELSGYADYAGLRNALLLAVLGMVVIGLFTLVCPLTTRYENQTIGLPSPQRLRALIIVTIAVGFAALLSQRALGIGVLGLEVHRLPLGLDTVINRTRSTIVPSVGLLALYYAIRLRRYETMAVISVTMFAVASSFVTTSRGMIFQAALGVLLLYLFTGKMKLRGRAFISVAGVMLVGLLAYPVITAARVQNVTGSQGTASAIGVRGLIDAGIQVATRVQGADGLLLLQSSPPAVAAPLGAKFSGPALSLAPYYTVNVAGVLRANDFRAPGLFGSFILVGGGLTLFPLVVLVFLGVLHAAARLLVSRGVPAVSAAMLSTYVFDLNEGTLAVGPLVFFVLSVLGVAALHRTLTAAQEDPLLIATRPGRRVSPRSSLPRCRPGSPRPTPTTPPGPR